MQVAVEHLVGAASVLQPLFSDEPLSQHELPTGHSESWPCLLHMHRVPEITLSSGRKEVFDKYKEEDKILSTWVKREKKKLKEICVCDKKNE